MRLKGVQGDLTATGNRFPMPASVRAAVVLLTLHGLALMWPFISLFLSPNNNLVATGDVASFGGVLTIPPAFFGGLLVITGTTGLPFWWIARPIAIALEVICVPVGWLALALILTIVGIEPVNTELTSLINGLLGFALAGIPALSCLVLLTRRSAHAWFRALRRRSG